MPASSYNPQTHHRRSIRLKGYDYTQPGAYFVTICADHGKWLFGEVTEGEMHLNQPGQITQYYWQKLPVHFPTITFGASVVMLNHFHGIIVIADTRRGEASGQFKPVQPELQRPEASPLHPIGTAPGSVGAIIQNFKSVAARKINQVRNVPGNTVWQRNYYEHIIRDQAEWERIHNYILTNPQNWEKDRFYCPRPLGYDV